jgi:hypothetical protein
MGHRIAMLHKHKDFMDLSALIIVITSMLAHHLSVRVKYAYI